MKKHSRVRNLITNDVITYYNGYDLETNLTSTIVLQEDANKLLHNKFREKITEIAKIEKIPSLDGSEKVYSSTYDMIAYHVITD